MMSDNGLRNDPINGVQRNLEEQAEEQDRQDEFEQEQRADKTKESNDDRYEVETQFVDTSSSGEGSTHQAKHLLTDTKIDVTLGVKERNVFDFGYTVHIFSNLDTVEADDWVDVAVTVTELKDPDVDSIAQKFEVKNALNEFPNDGDDGTIDIVIWDNSLSLDVEQGDSLILSSVVGNEFDEEVYLTVNSNSEVAQFRDVEDLRSVADDVESFVRANNSIGKDIRM